MDKKVVTPVYQQIAIDIASRIAKKDIPIGYKLKGRSVLAGEYNVSPETIRRSMHLLEDIDISIEYTGTAFVNIMGKKAISDSDETYKQAKEFFESNYELTWLKPLGFNNTYTLAVTKETTEIIVVSFVYFVIFIN